MIVKIKPLKGVEHDIEVSDEESVLSLQKKVLTTFGVPEESQRLVYKGAILSDPSKPLSHYRVENNCKLVLSVKALPQTPNQRLQSLLRKHLQTQYDDKQIELILSNFSDIINQRINSMSLNDIEKLAQLWDPDKA